MAKKTAPQLTEFTPESINNIPTRDQQLLEEYKKKMQMFAACCDREINRMANEKAVRIGDTVIHEAGLVEAMTDLLKEYKDAYQKASE